MTFDRNLFSKGQILSAVLVVLLLASTHTSTASSADFTITNPRITSPSSLPSGEYVRVSAYVSGTIDDWMHDPLGEWTPVFEVRLMKEAPWWCFWCNQQVGDTRRFERSGPRDLLSETYDLHRDEDGWHKSISQSEMLELTRSLENAPVTRISETGTYYAEIMFRMEAKSCFLWCSTRSSEWAATAHREISVGQSPVPTLSVEVHPNPIAQKEYLLYSGSGFTANGHVKIVLSDPGFVFGADADDSGQISGRILVGDNVPAGRHELVFTDESTGRTTTIQITVNSGHPPTQTSLVHVYSLPENLLGQDPAGLTGSDLHASVLVYYVSNAESQSMSENTPFDLQADVGSQISFQVAASPSGWDFLCTWDHYGHQQHGICSLAIQVPSGTQKIVAFFREQAHPPTQTSRVFVYSFPEGLLGQDPAQLASSDLGASIHVSYVLNKQSRSTTETTPFDLEADVDSQIIFSVASDPSGWEFSNAWDHYGYNQHPHTPNLEIEVPEGTQKIAAFFKEALPPTQTSRIHVYSLPNIVLGQDPAGLTSLDLHASIFVAYFLNGQSQSKTETTPFNLEADVGSKIAFAVESVPSGWSFTCTWDHYGYQQHSSCALNIEVPSGTQKIAAFFKESSQGKSHDLRFVARYVSGDLFLRNVFCSLDGGPDQLLGTVSDDGSWSFSARFSSSIHIYVNVNPGTTYYEALYVDGILVASGNVGNEGLWYNIVVYSILPACLSATETGGPSLPRAIPTFIEKLCFG